MNNFKDNYESTFSLLRTPLLDLNTAISFFNLLKKDDENLIPYFKSLSNKNPEILEAIYIASPILHAQILKCFDGKDLKKNELRKMRDSLYEYLCRMSTRCTPFGIFAGCNFTTWGDTSEVILENYTKQIIRKIRLDMDYTNEIVLYLLNKPEIRKHLIFYPNNSLYRVGKHYRYVEYRFDKNGFRTHHIVSVERNKVIDKVLSIAKEGVPYNTILDTLMQLGFNLTDSKEYLDSLITSQILLSEIDPTISGVEFSQKLIQVIKYKHKLDIQIINNLENAVNQFEKINRETDKINIYKTIYNTLQKENVKIKENRLFQIDSYKNFEKAQLSNEIKDQILDAVQMLQLLNKHDDAKKRISIFSRAFSEQYENRMVPLSEALDTQIGIGYRNAKSLRDYYSLTGTPNFDETFNLKFKKYTEWLKKGTGYITILDEDLKQIRSNPLSFPNSFGVLISHIQNNQDEIIYLRSCSGPSGANLIGRFASLDLKLEKSLQNFCKLEESLENEKVFAEILHLPQARIGNVLARPHLREYEIPYLASSNLSQEKQIKVEDLYLFMKFGKLVLYSKKINKEISPRLSTAHNFSNGLPVYNFLCDFQFQGLQTGAYWDWGWLNNQTYLPRVMYNKVVVSLAKWQFTNHFFKDVTENSSDNDIKIKFEKLQREFSIPDRVILSEGDNELWLDLSIPFCQKYLLKLVKKAGSCRLLENLWSSTQLIKDKSNLSYTNEFNIPFVKKLSKESLKKVVPAKNTKTAEKIKRKFIPGSEWVFFKIYCTTESANNILLSLQKVCDQLFTEKVVVSWFFIRYYDPKFHIRLRFKLADHKDSQKTNLVIAKLYENLNSYSNINVIKNLVLDTYIREIERYGFKKITLCEDIFHIESRLFLSLLKCKVVNPQRFQLYMIYKFIDNYFRFFYLSIDEILNFTMHQKRGFENRLKIGKNDNLVKILSSFYRQHSKNVDVLFINIKTNDNSFSTREANIIKKYSKKHLDGVHNLQEISNLKFRKKDYQNVLSSIIHMLTNRFLENYESFDEYKVYYFLNKYYSSLKARNKR